MKGPHEKQVVPSTDIEAVTPHDVNNIRDPVQQTRGIYVGGGGDLRVETFAGQDVTFSGVAAGTVLPVGVVKVWSTNTTATNIVALF